MPSCSQTCRRRPLHPPLPSNQQTAPTISATGLTAYSLFPPFFSRTRSSDNLTPRRHWCDPHILLLTNGNDSPQVRFQPARVCPLRHSIPLPDQNYFPFFAFSHPCSITQTIFLCHPGCRRTNTIFRILTGGIPNIKTGAAPEGLCRFLFLTLYAPSAVPFSPFCFQKIPRRRLAASISAATQTQPKPLIKRQHPYQLPDKPRRQPSEAVNPFLKILIKASEPLFSASPQSSGLAARASPAPPASSSHRSGFPPRSAARPSAWPVLPLHRSK